MCANERWGGRLASLYPTAIAQNDSQLGYDWYLGALLHH